MQGGAVAYWLMKTEPGDYSWQQLVKDGRAVWDGVHNHQAARNMRAMKAGDRAFFYRSMEHPAVVGVMEIVRAAYEDPGDPKASFVLVDVRPVMPVREEVSLSGSRRSRGCSTSRWCASRAFRSARSTRGMAADLRDRRHRGLSRRSRSRDSPSAPVAGA